jgi:transcriptional regulator with XRE-family HTH domain
MEKSDFAVRLASLRERAGMSQYRLAQLAGLTKQTISRLEMGESVPTWPTVQLIALALRLDYGALADPSLQLPEEKPAAPRGRPRKSAEATPAKKRKQK